MKCILITGGTGFFGKSIKDYLQRNLFVDDYQIATLSRHNADIIGDIRSIDLTGRKFDYIIHAATPARTDISDDEMQSIIIDGTKNMIKQAVSCNARKFMMISSGGVYGNSIGNAFSEDSIPNPFTIYGKSKLIAERMAIESGIYTVIPRCFAFIGKHLDRNIHFAAGNFIKSALTGKDIVINGDGTPIRSYMYADDLVEWLFTILEKGEHGRIYNVGSPDAISIRDLAYKVKTVLNSGSRVVINGNSQAGAANVYLPDVSRAVSELGCSIKCNLEDAIRKSTEV